MARSGKSGDMRHLATRDKCVGCLLRQAKDADALARDWRQGLPLDDRLALAAGLWKTNVHEARIAAAKLLTQARIRDDAPVWRLITAWLPDFDAWAIADHACMAGQRRVSARPDRLDEVERTLIQRSLLQHEGNVSRAAEALGISRSAFYRRMQKYGL